MITLRQNEKGNAAFDSENQLFGVDLHDMIQKQKSYTNVEMADGFGFSQKDVKELKRKLERN